MLSNNKIDIILNIYIQQLNYLPIFSQISMNIFDKWASKDQRVSHTMYKLSVQVSLYSAVRVPYLPRVWTWVSEEHTECSVGGREIGGGEGCHTKPSSPQGASSQHGVSGQQRTVFTCGQNWIKNTQPVIIYYFLKQELLLNIQT